MAAKVEDKKLLQRSQLRQHGEFWHVSVSERQRSRPCGQNLRVPFLRTVLPPEVGESARAMASMARQKRSYLSGGSRNFEREVRQVGWHIHSAEPRSGD